MITLKQDEFLTGVAAITSTDISDTNDSTMTQCTPLQTPCVVIEDEEDDVPLSRIAKNLATRNGTKKKGPKRSISINDENATPNVKDAHTGKGKTRKLKTVKKEK